MEGHWGDTKALLGFTGLYWALLVGWSSLAPLVFFYSVYSFIKFIPQKEGERREETVLDSEVSIQVSSELKTEKHVQQGRPGPL